MPIYTNAESVLPPDLLREVKKHWNGLLYIPSDRMTATPNEDVLLAIQSGCPAQEVALAHDIPVWQVYRIARRLDRLNPFDNPSRHLGGRPLRCPDAK